MGIHYRVDRDNRVLRIDASGLVTDEDLADCVSGIVTDPEVRPGMDVIVDLRKLHESVLSRAGIDRALRILVELGQMACGNRLVVVERILRAPRTAAIELLSSRFSATLRVCSELDDAKSWLGMR